MTLRYEDRDKKYWDWLADDNEELGRIKFSKKLDEIKNSVQKLYQQHDKKEAPLPYYTPHGIEHLKAVEDNLHLLIHEGNHEKLTKVEKYYLLGSAWLHDIGMLTNIFQNESEDIEPKIIRENHNLRSESFIIENWPRCGIEEFDAPGFSLLAKFHRRKVPIKDCEEKLETKYGTIRLRLLAAYLRLADALHIDITRTPASAYAICLSYDIPNYAKLHWIKSKFVLSIDIDPDNHLIGINLRNPFLVEATHDKKIEERIRSIHRLIINDFSEELNSIKEILIQEGITYFLQVSSIEHSIKCDHQLMIDIKGLLTNYDILVHPSSSSLTQLILDTMYNILSPGPSLDKFLDEKGGYIEINETKINDLKNFIKEVKKDILASRGCHFSLKNLINELTDDINNNNSDLIPKKIRDHIKDLDNDRNSIRFKSKKYFEKEIISINSKYWNEIMKTILVNQGNIKSITPFNILLYGYSTLVIKTLCGFRDIIINYLIKAYSIKMPDNLPLHKFNFERIASNFFRIFLCEAQPKTQTAPNDSLVFHDGIRYALSLKEHGFEELYIIPDAIAGSLINSFGELNDEEIIKADKPYIHFIIVGANGFDKDIFLHSAGHATIVKLAKCVRVKHNNFPKVILSTLTNKFSIQSETEKHEDFINIKQKNEIINNNGWLFRNSFNDEPVRDKIFISQDIELQKSLYKSRISFYNPREDKIPIKNYLDVIICEKGYILKPESGDMIKNL